MAATGSMSQAAIETTTVATPGAVGSGLILILVIVSVVAIALLARAAHAHINDKDKRVPHPDTLQRRLFGPVFLALSAAVLGLAYALLNRPGFAGGSNS